MSFVKYEEYKPSGLGLTPEVPAHWESKPLKRLAQIVMGQSPSSRDYNEAGLGEPFLQGNADFGELHPECRTYCTSASKFAAPGGVLVSVRAPVGAINIADKRFAIGRGLCSIEAYAQALPKFLYYYAHAIKPELEAVATGSTYVAVTAGQVGNISCSLPPIDEQLKLVSFLDRETAKIDALVAEQQRLIELLEEKRQAVISHAVSKGLNSNAPMKDSGVEWLGEVPDHWEVGALSYALIAIGDVDHYMPPSVADGVPYVMTGDLKELASQIDFKGCKQVAHLDYDRLCKKVKTTRGDLIMARYATIGTVTYVDLDCEFLVSYSCVTIKPRTEKVLGEYLYFCLKSDSFVQGISGRINTNTQGNVGIADLRKIKVALPPVDEQLEITEYLQVSVAEMGEIIERSETVISLLKERRFALISSAVTGQFDVRCLVPAEAAA